MGMNLIMALSLWLKLHGTCLITPLHIAVEENLMTDIPSRSFGSKQRWHCRLHTDLLKLFNNPFLLPQQNSWTYVQLTPNIGMRVTFALVTKDFILDEWR
jgi:hypothetical protein